MPLGFCQIRNYDSATNNYLIKLEECNQAIQNPAELKSIFVSMHELSKARQPSQHQQDSISGLNHDQMNDNQLTFLYLGKMSELEELKSEEMTLASKFGAEKADQIAANAVLLKQISGRTSPTRRRSSIFKS